jgi:hypothetical protein
MALHRKSAWTRFVTQLKDIRNVRWYPPERQYSTSETAEAHDRRPRPARRQQDKRDEVGGYPAGSKQVGQLDPPPASLRSHREPSGAEDIRAQAASGQAVRDQAPWHADDDTPEAFRRTTPDRPGGLIAPGKRQALWGTWEDFVLPSSRKSRQPLDWDETIRDAEAVGKAFNDTISQIVRDIPPDSEVVLRFPEDTEGQRYEAIVYTYPQPATDDPEVREARRQRWVEAIDRAEAKRAAESRTARDTAVRPHEEPEEQPGAQPCEQAADGTPGDPDEPEAGPAGAAGPGCEQEPRRAEATDETPGAEGTPGDRSPDGDPHRESDSGSHEGTAQTRGSGRSRMVGWPPGTNPWADRPRVEDPDSARPGDEGDTGPEGADRPTEPTT